MTTVSWRLGVAYVVVAIVLWNSLPRPRPDTFPTLVAKLPLASSASGGSSSLSSKDQLPLIADQLHPILIREAPPSGLNWKEIERRGVITFLLPHSASAYFLYRGGQMGFEYELASEFAKEIGVELEVITPPPGTELTEWLAEGKGDIAAGITITNESDLKPLYASISYLDTTATLITRREEKKVWNTEALLGKSIAIQPDAAYAASLFTPSESLPFRPLLTTITNEESISGAVYMMQQGQAAAALVTTPFADLAQRLHPRELRAAYTFPNQISTVWAIRPEDSALQEKINIFLEHAVQSGLRKILFEKYFVTAAHLSNNVHQQEVTLISKRLTKYDRLIAHHAEEAGFDWRLIAALIFEESRFNHDRVSEAGAYGLMQITPIVARNIGVKDYSQPTSNIEAGIKYLKMLSGRFPDGQPRDRLAFVLASYVMGLGHVDDARQLARRLGYDSDCWDDSMARVIPLLEKPKYYRQTQYGAAQGKEAVRYVTAILKRYSLYSHYVSRELPARKARAKASRQAASAAG